MIKMVLKYVVLLIVLFECNLCLKLNGTCPVVENTDAFICSEHFQDAVIVEKCILINLQSISFNISGSPISNGSLRVREQFIEFIL